jgi:hypothetical protein
MTGRTTYQDTRGIGDVLLRKDSKFKQSLGQDLLSYGSRIGTMATRIDPITPNGYFLTKFSEKSFSV